MSDIKLYRTILPKSVSKCRFKGVQPSLNSVVLCSFGLGHNFFDAGAWAFCCGPVLLASDGPGGLQGWTWLVAVD